MNTAEESTNSKVVPLVESQDYELDNPQALRKRMQTLKKFGSDDETDDSIEVNKEDFEKEKMGPGNRDTFTRHYSENVDQPLLNKQDTQSKSAGEKPTHWIYEVGSDKPPQKYMGRRFCSNSIRTSKYTCLSFLPLNLFHQITKAANFYFLVISGLQMIKPISITGGSPTNLPPLIFVMTISMIKDLVEDRKRSSADRQENMSKTIRVFGSGGQGGQIEEKVTAWKDIKVGDIVKVQNNEFFPADLVLLKSSSEKRICYVETKNLDGETNLKHKMATKETTKMLEKDINLDCKVICEPPNDQIYKFDGVLKFCETNEKLTLSYENFLLRGSSLRNTDWIYGVVTHTGHDTRIFKNSVKARPKLSRLERGTSKQIGYIFLLQVIMCSIAAFYSTVWNNIYSVSTNAYLDLANKEGAPDGDEDWTTGYFIKVLIETLGTWILLFTNMVPISLLVTLELVKFWQAKFIGWDADIYDDEKDMETKVQSSNLNEELGQISYVFSDKTGTLTCNVMEFKKFTAGMKSYGNSLQYTDNVAAMKRRQFGYTDKLVPNVNFDCDQFYTDFGIDANQQDIDSKQQKRIETMLVNLAVNHTVVVEKKDGELLYNASSPDELALVNAARFHGITFEGRDEDNNLLINCRGTQKKYQLLSLIEFTSTRKRMTSVVKDPEGKIIVMCKGADSILLPLLKQKQDHHMMKLMNQTNEFMEDFAKEGLRTLLIAQRVMKTAEFAKWIVMQTNALQSLENRDKLLEEAAAALEQNFDLVGSTAIEDKLQTGVPDTIEMIKQAGVKLWVLTGDKIETAINIGYSCKLLDDDIQQYIIDGSRSVDIYKQICIAENKQNLYMGTKEMAVIVGGESLLKIFEQDKLKEKFIKLTEQACVVLACRVSPKQKALIVEMVRHKHPEATTLAIGDGANDVNMITAAHVGVGISGLEGQQAARSADYAIGQFQFLRPLLFYHGREAYRRNSFLVIYMFYKNILFVMPQFWYGFDSAFSGQTLYEAWLYQLYNIVFTALPIIFFAMLDNEYVKKTFLKEPSLYHIGLESACFNNFTFWLAIFQGVFNGFWIMVFTFYGIDGLQIIRESGYTGSFWISGQLAYCSVVLVANFYVFYFTNNHTVISIISTLLSIICFFIFYWAESQSAFFPQVQFAFEQTYDITEQQTSYYILFLIVIFNMFQIMTINSAQIWWQDRKARIAKRREELRKEKLDQQRQNMASADYKNSFKLTASVVEKELQGDFDEMHDGLFNKTAQQAAIVGSVGLQSQKTSVLHERRGTVGFAFSGEAGNAPDLAYKTKLTLMKTLKAMEIDQAESGQAPSEIIEEDERSDDSGLKTDSDYGEYEKGDLVSDSVHDSYEVEHVKNHPTDTSDSQGDVPTRFGINAGSVIE